MKPAGFSAIHPPSTRGGNCGKVAPLPTSATGTRSNVASFMDDQSSIAAPDPFQEYQTQDPRQERQIRTTPPPVAGQQEFVPTTASTLDDLVRNAYFVAASIDAPIVEVVNPHVVNLHYPADGSCYG